MGFEVALKAMKEGEKAMLYDNVYYIKDGDIRVDWYTGEEDYPVMLNGDEIMSEDWEIVNE